MSGYILILVLIVVHPESKVSVIVPLDSGILAFSVYWNLLLYHFYCIVHVAVVNLSCFAFCMILILHSSNYLV